jgi:hypothetical protein
VATGHVCHRPFAFFICTHWWICAALFGESSIWFHRPTLRLLSMTIILHSSLEARPSRASMTPVAAPPFLESQKKKHGTPQRRTRTRLRSPPRGRRLVAQGKQRHLVGPLFPTLPGVAPSTLAPRRPCSKERPTCPTRPTQRMPRSQPRANCRRFRPLRPRTNQLQTTAVA